MHMNEEKRATYGFKIKWADREIEYYGDSVAEMFRIVFDHVKSAPITYVQPVQPSAQVSMRPPSTTVITETPPAIVEDDEYNRIMKDAQVTKDQVLSVIRFEQRAGFSEPIPCLPGHPQIRDAVVLVSYALQLGFQKTQIEVAEFKKILREDGYPLPGNELGLILRDFRNSGVTIASQTKGQYKPFTLGKKGLERARNLLKTGGK